MAGVRDHTELEVWQLADTLRRDVYEAARSPGFRHHPELQRQLVTAADSVAANIAEGFARYQPRDFARFMRIARGSIAETMDHITVAQSRGLLTAAQAESLFTLARRTRGASTRLIRYLETARVPGGR